MNSLRWQAPCAALMAGAVLAAFAQPASALQTKSFVVGYFTMATYSEEGDCAGGLNPGAEEQFRRNLVDAGLPKAEIEAFMGNLANNVSLGANSTNPIINRGRIDGKPVNAYANPASVKDPKLKSVTGKVAYGFNLDGKGAASPNSFEDPETHDKGVNNQLVRALACSSSLRGKPPERPTFFLLWWGVIRESAPAWLITVSGEDLTKDGDVTVTFDRALEHASKDANSETRSGMTFRVDPSPTSHSVFKGKIANNVVSITEPGHLRLQGDALINPMFELSNTHLRLKILPDGKADGIVGGYQPWKALYFGMALDGYNVEKCVNVDFPGIYHALKRMADADPDPATGQNRSISAAWHIEAVPAFVVNVDGSLPQKTAAK